MKAMKYVIVILVLSVTALLCMISMGVEDMLSNVCVIVDGGILHTLQHAAGPHDSHTENCTESLLQAQKL